MEVKKIKILKKREVQQPINPQPIRHQPIRFRDNSPSEEELKAEELLKELNEIYDRIERSISGDQEKDFVEEHKGKNVVLMLRNGNEVCGQLVDIGSFGVFVEENNKTKYFYKHSITAYYSVN